MSLSHNFDSEVSAVIGTEGIAEHLEMELNQVNAALYSIRPVLIFLKKTKNIDTPCGQHARVNKLTSNFSELCMPGMDCIRWEVG